MKWIRILPIVILIAGQYGCKKNEDTVPDTPFTLKRMSIDGVTVNGATHMNVHPNSDIRLTFGQPIDNLSLVNGIDFTYNNGLSVTFGAQLENKDSTIRIGTGGNIGYLTKSLLKINTQLKSKGGGSLAGPITLTFVTRMDSADKFPVISDDSLLTLVQKNTFSYFYYMGHPVSGLAHERHSPGVMTDPVTSGGSGFGIMGLVVGVHRGFITRAEGLARMQKIVSFLKNTADKFHGAFPHWLNGTTGDVMPFSQKDNGADLVETSYLIQGLLCARQYFNGADAAETNLRADINTIWNGVEWDWFRQNNQNVLYWHWSPDYNWEMNHQIKGWNECLITYVLAASSTTHSIPKVVYTEGWASNGGMMNGSNYFGYQLPLGPEKGGPLFFAHYSFLGINPNNLTDAYANYFTQNKNHTLINRAHCIANPNNYFGYGENCWGLTASDIRNGYAASSPTNDLGYIAPTAALSSFPYTPAESMKALKFFYYKLGDKIWNVQGFSDAFSLNEPWFADSYLAIDQGPILVMIENYRSGLLWNLFMSCPEVKTGMTALGFQSPYL